MINKIKPWMLHSITDEAREEAWKVAQAKNIKIGEAVNFMLIDYDKLKTTIIAYELFLDNMPSVPRKLWWKFWG